MRQPKKPVISRAYLPTLITAQVLCIALGLFFYHNYIASSVQQSLEQEARAQLARNAAQVAQAVGPFVAQDRRGPSAQRAIYGKRLSQALAGGNYQLALVDTEWRVVATAAPQASPDANLNSITWLRSSAHGPTHGEPIRGSIETPTGLHAAVAFPLPSGSGYVVAHRDITGDRIRAAEIRPMLWAATCITLLWACGLSAVTLYMAVGYFHGTQKNEMAQPDGDALKQAQALLRTQETVIFGLAKLSDSRDPETGDHLDRIAYYSTMLASAMRQHPDFCDVITASYVHLIGISSALHDIGKVGVEDAILRKPASLTPQERTRMKEHTRVGEECLKEIERRLGTSNFLQMAREIASSHHERWDGAGYPEGLVGEHIPLAARIVAVADVYDALSSKRVYKEAIPHPQCVAMIAEEAGYHFDPRIVEVFLKIEAKFEQVSRQLGALPRASAVVQDGEDETIPHVTSCNH